MNMVEEDRAPVVRVGNLTKVFRDFWRRPKVCAVDNVSFDVGRGEVLGLLGPNGSGKSTTLKAILGLLHPTAGTIEVFGRPAGEVSTKAKVGYLPEESCLYRFLTARETLDFYCRLFDIDGKTRRQRIEQLLGMSGLMDAADRPVGEFSKGMMRRVGLAQALVNDPDLVILDEPSAGLDPVACRQVKDLILTLARRGKTVLLASHLLADVEDVCNRIAIFYNGRIRAYGSVNELLAEPAKCRLTVPVLPPDAMKRVLDAVREMIGGEPEVDRPTRNLEQFFLEIVGKAGGAGSGAGAPAGIARYLSAPEAT